IFKYLYTMKKSFLTLSFLLFALVGCSDDGNSGGGSISVSFATLSVNLTEDTTPVVISFSKLTSSSGTITLSVVETSADYGVDYTTEPVGSSSVLELDFEAGVLNVAFDFNKLIPAIEGQVKNVEYTIT